MNTLPINTIIVGDRQRKDYKNVDRLANSIRRLGLIQPIVVRRSDNTLVAGGRRLTACRSLGWTDIPVTFKEELTEAQLHVLELEENVNREDLHWTERCRAISAIHSQHNLDSVLEGESWTMEQTAELLGLPGQKSRVWYAIEVARALDNNDTEVTSCPMFTDAVRLLCKRREEQAAKTLVSRQLARPTLVMNVDPKPLNAEVVRATEAQRDVSLIQTICGDSLNYLRSCEPVDCIYTDPPYAINMDNLQQDGGGMNVERTVDEHQVTENRQLLEHFVALAATKLKPTGFLVMWCDTEQWDWLKTLASDAGLAVQHWPLLWIKPHAQNMAATYNFTKACECAMVARMPGAILRKMRSTNWWLGPSDKDSHGVHHPFWKPTQLHAWVLDAIAFAGERILDPFAGAGSIPLACALSGRPCTAIELREVHYLEMIDVLARCTPKH